MIGKGGEAVQLCLTAGEQGEPAAHCIHKDGLGEVELRQGLDLFEALLLWAVQSEGSQRSPSVKHS